MKLFKIITCLILILLCSMKHTYARELINKIVAIVNDEFISTYELDKYSNLVTSNILQDSIKKEIKLHILQNMILKTIQMQLSKKNNLVIDTTTVLKIIKEIAVDQRMSLKDLKQDIESRGIKFSEYRDLINKELMIQALYHHKLNHKIIVKNHEIEKFLHSMEWHNQYKNDIYNILHILLEIPDPQSYFMQKAITDAEKLVIKLRLGKDFFTIPLEKSFNINASKRSDLGWHPIKDLPTLFINYMPSMKVGDIVGPILDESGIHIIKLYDKYKKNEKKEPITESHVLQIIITFNEIHSEKKAKIMINHLYNKIKNRSDFNKIATKYSNDLYSAKKGGDIGWVREDMVHANFAKNMRKLHNGEISRPFKTEKGWTIIKILDKRNCMFNKEEWNKAELILNQQKTNEAIEEWINLIRSESHVEIL